MLAASAIRPPIYTTLKIKGGRQPPEIPTSPFVRFLFFEYHAMFKISHNQERVVILYKSFSEKFMETESFTCLWRNWPKTVIAVKH